MGNGCARCGALCSIDARSWSASFTILYCSISSCMIAFCRYRTPPWINFVLRDDVPDAKSSASTNAVFKPSKRRSVRLCSSWWKGQTSYLVCRHPKRILLPSHHLRLSVHRNLATLGSSLDPLVSAKSFEAVLVSPWTRRVPTIERYVDVYMYTWLYLIYYYVLILIEENLVGRNAFNLIMLIMLFIHLHIYILHIYILNFFFLV